MKKNVNLLCCALVLLIASLSLGACAARVEPRVTSASTPTPTATRRAIPTVTPSSIIPSCELTPMVAPTMAPDPGRNMLDKTTDLHMTGSPVVIDLASYRLKVTGLVDHPLSLSLDALRCMPKVTATPTLVCPGFFQDTATWSGVTIKYILELAGIQSEAYVIIMVAADQYEHRMDIQTALDEENFLAYEWEGQPLPILHGFPLRAVIPSMPGEYSVKWLLEIRVE